MSGLKYTLLGDGSSDQVLDLPIRWLLRKLGVAIEIGQWADLSHLKSKPRTLDERIRAALEVYPAEILFVHRDAEAQSRASRIAEIRSAIGSINVNHVPIVPVRMTEAWFLHDEQAIRRASGNANGTNALYLPRLGDIESIVDPKQHLRNALLAATELRGHRLSRKKRPTEFSAMRARTAELVAEYDSLTVVPAFSAFVSDLKIALISSGHVRA